LLAQYFLERGATRNNKAVEGISSSAARLLVDYDWPGNVRELENCMERAVALCQLSEITIDDLPERLHGQKSNLVVSFESPADMVTLPEMERRYIRYVLRVLDNNKTHAARALGIDRRSLYRRLADPSFAADLRDGKN
jgi:two-component system response regulator HydG